MGFRDLGIAVDAVESRTAAVCINAEGSNRLVIAAKGFLLVVDPETEHCEQIAFPNGNTEYPYETFSSSQGIFYIGAGAFFYAFDPFNKVYIDCFKVGSDDELCGFSYAEDKQGHIYMASYPQSRLYRYRPAERDITSFGSMDPEQKYPFHMAADAYDWIYIGIGTTNKTIVAFHPPSGNKEIIQSSGIPVIGTGLVRQGPSYEAYAQLDQQWVRLEQGLITANVQEEQLPRSLYHGESFGKFHRQLSGSWQIIRHSLSDRELVLRYLSTGQEKVIRLHYESQGAQLSPITIGPGGKIYGTSNHPLHFYTYDPSGDENTVHNWGSKIIQHGAGGNIAAYAVLGSQLLGASYPGGRLHLYDTDKPLLLDDSSERNPQCITEHMDIHRPRCAVALSDGEHMVYGGFPGYGMIGGGLCISHIPSGNHQLIQHTELIYEQSTVAIVESIDGTLIGGTSIETPGGANPREHSAYLYAFDWQNRAVLKKWRPVPKAREYSLLLIDSNGWIHALTSCSTYFVWDPTEELIRAEADLSAWGSIVRQGWQLCEEDQCIYGVLSGAVYRIPLISLKPERLAVPPQIITAGFVKINHELYFASSTHLWSYSIKEG